jgi:RND superfamily putative drug exporter
LPPILRPRVQGGRDVLQRIALLAIAAPRRVIAVTLLVMLAAGIFGVPVAKSLSSSGFQDPTSESARATQLLTDKFHQGDLQMLITVTAPDSANGRGEVGLPR